MKSRPLYIPTLDGWRAIAILLVLASHEVVHSVGAASSTALNLYGRYGVDVFFAISGFLICTLLLDEQQRTGAISLRSFYLRRAFRILPAALIYLVAIATLRAMGIISGVRPAEWLGSLLFVRNLQSLGPSSWYTSHFWSLSVEEHFYFILPGLLVLLSRRFRSAPSPRGTDPRALILFLISAVILPTGIFLSRIRSGVFTDYKLGAIFLAASAAVFLWDADLRARVARILPPATVVPFTAALTIVITGRKALLVLPFLFLASVLSTVLHPTAFLSRILESKPLRFIGKRSYSLYLWQQLFLSAHFGPPEMRLQRWPLSLLCAFAAACLSYALIERPMIRLGHRLAARSSNSSPSLDDGVPALSA
jgi:peptidoglycan/LPS O-acetylase OafA/YrhL